MSQGMSWACLKSCEECQLKKNAVKSISVCGGQGFTKCGCSANGKLRCNTKTCACKKAAMLCNSRCHPNIACNNK